MLAVNNLIRKTRTMFDESDDLFDQTGNMANSESLVEVGLGTLNVLVLFLSLLLLQERTLNTYHRAPK